MTNPIRTVSVGSLGTGAEKVKRGVTLTPRFVLVDDTGLEPVTPGM